MHIGIVLPSVPGYSETFFRSKIEGLQNNGFKVTLFVKNPKGVTSFICPVKVHPMLCKHSALRFIQTVYLVSRTFFRVPKKTLRIIDIAKKNNFSLFQGIKSVVIASTILTEKLDWLHFGFATPALEREFIGRAMGAKVAVSFRGFDLNQTPLSDHNIYKNLWPNIDKVHSISHYLIDKGVELGLDKNTPFQIITPAIDGNRFSSKTDLRKSNTILLVSRLHWIKGIEYVLEAISEVKKRISDISVTIVGEGEERERLIFAAYQLGILKQINFVGKQEHNNIQDFMQTNEVFIQYSHQEGFCNAVLEAQAAALLCIVSDAEGLQENVLDGKTGWVVPKRNPEALALKLLEVLKLPESDKEKIRQQAQDRVMKDFNLEKQQQEFVTFYSEDLA